MSNSCGVSFFLDSNSCHAKSPRCLRSVPSHMAPQSKPFRHFSWARAGLPVPFVQFAVPWMDASGRWGLSRILQPLSSVWVFRISQSRMPAPGNILYRGRPMSLPRLVPCGTCSNDHQILGTPVIPGNLGSKQKDPPLLQLHKKLHLQSKLTPSWPTWSNASSLRELQQDVDMAEAQTETASQHRLVQLEADVQELRAQSKKFESWFQDAGDQVAGLKQQVGTLATKVQEQMSTTDSLHQMMGSMQASLQHELQNSMAQQTERLEALLSKQRRTA